MEQHQNPYQTYVGQQGYNMKMCRSIDEQNIPYTLCQMTIHSSPDNNVFYPPDNYLSLNDNLSNRIISCQNITASYYPDMTQEAIGKRPVYSSRFCEYNIPSIIYQNKKSLTDHQFGCYQPFWNPTCM